MMRIEHIVAVIYPSFPLIGAFLFFAAAMLTIFKRKKAAIDYTFILMSLLAFLMQVDIFLVYYFTSQPAIAGILGKVGWAVIIALLMPVYLFGLQFVGMNTTDRFLLKILFVFVGISEVVLWGTDYFINGYYIYPWGYWPRANFFHAVFVIGYVIFFFRVVVRIYRSVKEKKYKDNYHLAQARYMLLGYLFFSFGCIDFIGNYGYKVYPLGFIFVVLFISTIYYSMYRFRLLDVRVAVIRAGLILLLYTIVLGIPFIVAVIGDSWIIPLILMAVLGSAGPFIYISLKTRAENVLMVEQRHYQKILLQASIGMVKQHDLNRLLKFSVYIINKAVRVNFTAVLLDSKENEAYQLRSIRDTQDRMPVMSLPYTHPLINFMRAYQEPFTFAELPASIREQLNADIGIQLIIPLINQNRLIGFLVLGRKRNNSIYSQGDIDVFKTLANQMALAIENCLYVREMQNAQERVFAAEKLASVGGMAEGIAHQIKNRLAEFSLSSQLIKSKVHQFLERHAALAEATPEVKDLLASMVNVTQKQKGYVESVYDIVKAILNYSKIEVSEQDFATFPLAEIINPSLELLKIKHNIAEFPLQIDTGDTDGTLRGVKAQLMESVYNILDNAYEAVKEKEQYIHNNGGEPVAPSITLKLYLDGTTKVLDIIDNGIGIREENLAKVFAPFFSTKSSNKSGSGIGMYIVKRMIEEGHNGKISLISEYKVGTTTRIELPA